MTHRRNNITAGCPEWVDQVPALLELPEDDEVRMAWEQHTANCTSCRAVLYNEIRLRAQLEKLPDPGPARIANRVMHRIRGKERSYIPFRPRDLGWGLAGSLAGVLLGVWLAGAINTMPVQANPLSGYEQILSELTEGIDPLMSELFGDSQETSD